MILADIELHFTRLDRTFVFKLERDKLYTNWHDLTVNELSMYLASPRATQEGSKDDRSDDGQTEARSEERKASDRLQSVIRGLKIENKRLEKEMEALKSAVSATETHLQAENKRLEEEMEALKSASATETELKNLKIENKRLEEQVEAVEATNQAQEAISADLAARSVDASPGVGGSNVEDRIATPQPAPSPTGDNSDPSLEHDRGDDNHYAASSHTPSDADEVCMHNAKAEPPASPTQTPRGSAPSSSRLRPSEYGYSTADPILVDSDSDAGTSPRSGRDSDEEHNEEQLELPRLDGIFGAPTPETSPSPSPPRSTGHESPRARNAQPEPSVSTNDPNLPSGSTTGTPLQKFAAHADIHRRNEDDTRSMSSSPADSMDVDMDDDDDVDDHLSLGSQVASTPDPMWESLDSLSPLTAQLSLLQLPQTTPQEEGRNDEEEMNEADMRAVPSLETLFVNREGQATDYGEKRMGAVPTPMRVLNVSPQGYVTLPNQSHSQAGAGGLAGPSGTHTISDTSSTSAPAAQPQAPPTTKAPMQSGGSDAPARHLDSEASARQRQKQGSSKASARPFNFNSSASPSLPRASTSGTAAGVSAAPAGDRLFTPVSPDKVPTPRASEKETAGTAEQQGSGARTVDERDSLPTPPPDAESPERRDTIAQDGNTGKSSGPALEMTRGRQATSTLNGGQETTDPNSGSGSDAGSGTATGTGQVRPAWSVVHPVSWTSRKCRVPNHHPSPPTPPS